MTIGTVGDQLFIASTPRASMPVTTIIGKLVLVVWQCFAPLPSGSLRRAVKSRVPGIQIDLLTGSYALQTNYS